LISAFTASVGPLLTRRLPVEPLTLEQMHAWCDAMPETPARCRSSP
jgi:hypothetical protein